MFYQVCCSSKLLRQYVFPSNIFFVWPYIVNDKKSPPPAAAQGVAFIKTLATLVDHFYTFKFNERFFNLNVILMGQTTTGTENDGTKEVMHLRFFLFINFLLTMVQTDEISTLE